MTELERAQRARNRQALERFVHAIGVRDYAALRAVCTPDFVCELPYSDAGPVRLEGFDDYLVGIQAAFEIFRFELKLTEVHEGLDPDRLTAEYEGEGIAVPTGKPYCNLYIGVWRFRDGQVCGLREYYNPATAAESLRGGTN